MYDEKTHDLLGGNIINMFARIDIPDETHSPIPVIPVHSIINNFQAVKLILFS